MINGLFDKQAVFQVLGCLIQDPNLLDNNNITPEDFNGEDFHQIVFGAIYNLHYQGVNVIDCFAIDSYLNSFSKQYKIFSDNNGLEYVSDACAMAEMNNFDYNLTRVKKFTLLRYYDSQGLDIRRIYDPTVIDPVKQEEEMRKFNDYSIQGIIDLVAFNLVTKPQITFSSDANGLEQSAGVGMKEQKEAWKKEPEIGIPLQSQFMNTVARGARIKKFYLRSGSTASGKTRTAVGDACTGAVPWFYDTDQMKWVYTGFAEPTLFISTELEIEEVQSLIIAFVSGVNESHIIDGTYEGDEEERVDQAIEYIQTSPIYIKEMFDFDIQDIENIIVKYKKEKLVQYVYFDYLHTSVKLIMQIANMSKGMKLQEYQILYIFASKLKTLANTLQVHISSSTQLNGEYKDTKIKDETLLRGSKSIADRIDIGVISLPPTKDELKGVENILRQGIYPVPNLIYHVYKVRRGKLTRVRLWLHADLGTCRTRDLFVTDNDYNLIPVERLTIEYIDKVLEENSVDEKEIVAEPDDAVHLLGSNAIPFNF